MASSPEQALQEKFFSIVNQHDSAFSASQDLYNDAKSTIESIASPEDITLSILTPQSLIFRVAQELFSGSAQITLNISTGFSFTPDQMENSTEVHETYFRELTRQLFGVEPLPQMYTVSAPHSFESEFGISGENPDTITHGDFYIESLTLFSLFRGQLSSALSYSNEDDLLTSDIQSNIISILNNSSNGLGAIPSLITDSLPHFSESGVLQRLDDIRNSINSFRTYINGRTEGVTPMQMIADSTQYSSLLSSIGTV